MSVSFALTDETQIHSEVNLRFELRFFRSQTYAVFVDLFYTARYIPIYNLNV